MAFFKAPQQGSMRNLARSYPLSQPICNISRARATHLPQRLKYGRAFGRYLSSSTSNPAIHHELHEHSSNNSIAKITISNPQKLNILNSSLLDQLTQTCSKLSSHPTLRAVTLTGAPAKTPSFIGGADIKEMHSLASPSEARSFITKIHKASQALRDLPVPVVARIDGLCLGAGLELAVACDLRIATEASRFAMPEVRIGIPSVVEAALLPGLIGFGRTRRLLYLAETIRGVEAEKWGLIEKVVKVEKELDEGVKHWVDAICAMGPKAMRSQKRLILDWEKSSVDEGIQAGVEAFEQAYADEDGAEPRRLMGDFINRKR